MCTPCYVSAGFGVPSINWHRMRHTISISFFRAASRRSAFIHLIKRKTSVSLWDWSCLTFRVPPCGFCLAKDRADSLSASVFKMVIIIVIIINPLTARVVRAPQIILQPVFSIFPVLHCPLGLAELQACPFPDVVFLPFPLSALPSSTFHCA